MGAETVQQLLRERAEDDRVGVRSGDDTWTWREHLAEAAAEAAAVIALADPTRPLHVGVLLGNTVDMLRSMAAAALGGYVLVGLNTTRQGPALLADIRRADCQLLLVNAEHAPLLDGLATSTGSTSTTWLPWKRARLPRKRPWSRTPRSARWTPS